MLSPFTSSHLSFLPLQAVLYFSVSSSACPNSQLCFPTFSFSRNTRHSVNFPFDFFIAFPLKSDSQLFLPGPPSWGLLENLLSWAGEKRRRLPRCPVFPVFPLPSSRLTPSSPPVPTQVHFHWDRPPVSFHGRTSCSPPVPVTRLLCVSFTWAGSCSSAVFSIYSLKPAFSIFFPHLPGNALQSLTPCYSQLLGQVWPAQWLSVSFPSDPMGLPSSYAVMFPMHFAWLWPF